MTKHEHPRKLIRAYVVNLLSQLMHATSRVFNSRVDPIQENEVFPLINVVMLDESADLDPFERGPIRQMVKAELQIQAIVKHNETYADDLDDLLQQIEDAIPYNLGKTSTVQSCLYKETQIVINPEGANPYAVGMLKYEVAYLVNEGGLPNDADLDDLEEIHTDWDMAEPANVGGGPDDQIDAQDIIDSLQS